MSNTKADESGLAVLTMQSTISHSSRATIVCHLSGLGYFSLTAYGSLVVIPYFQDTIERTTSTPVTLHYVVSGAILRYAEAFIIDGDLRIQAYEDSTTHQIAAVIASDNPFTLPDMEFPHSVSIHRQRLGEYPK